MYSHVFPWSTRLKIGAGVRMSPLLQYHSAACHIPLATSSTWTVLFRKSRPHNHFIVSPSCCHTLAKHNAIARYLLVYEPYTCPSLSTHSLNPSILDRSCSACNFHFANFNHGFRSSPSFLGFSLGLYTIPVDTSKKHLIFLLAASFPRHTESVCERALYTSSSCEYLVSPPQLKT